MSESYKTSPSHLTGWNRKQEVTKPNTQTTTLNLR